MLGRLAALGLLSLLSAGGASAREPANLGQAALLSASCSGCHSEDGKAIPGLAALTAAELESKLLAYRSDPAGDSSMHRMARGYSEQQIEAIAEFLGK